MERLTGMSVGAAAKAAAVLAVVATVALPAYGAETAPKTVRVEVLDASGKPAKDAEVALVTPGRGPFAGWIKAPNGRAELAILPWETSFPPFSPFGGEQEEIVARAPGFAPVKVEWDPQRGPTATVRLNRGKRVKIEITTADGQPVPDGLTPIIFTPKAQRSILMNFAVSAPTFAGTLIRYYSVERRGPGLYHSTVSPDDGPLTVYVDYPGLLRGFSSEAFEPKVWDKPIKVQLPAAATLAATFEPKPVTRTDQTTFTARGRMRLPLTFSHDLAVMVTTASQPHRAVFADLAPGEYEILAETGTGAVRRAWAAPEPVTVESAASVTVALTQRPALPALRVTDAAATTRTVRASAYVIPGAKGNIGLSSPDWIATGPDGRIRFDMGRLDLRRKTDAATAAECGVLVKAPGFAAKMLTLETSTTPTPEVVIPLERGYPLEIVLEPPEGMTIPEDLRSAVWLRPFGAFVNVRHHATTGAEVWARSPVLDTERIGPGRYRVRVTTDTKQLVVGVHHAGFLTRFVSEPYSSADFAHGRLVVRLPKPGGVEVSVDGREYLKGKGSGPDTIALMLGSTKPSAPPVGFVSGWLVRADLQDGKAVYRTTDLSPGVYHALVTFPADAGDSRRNPLRGRAQVKVESGTTATATIALSEASGDSGPGQWDLPEIRVLSATGQPVTDARIFARRIDDTLNVRPGQAVKNGLYRCAPLFNYSMATGEPLTSATAELLVTAPGHALTTVTLEVPTQEKQVTVRLGKGQKVELHLKPPEGTSVPETLEPIIYDEASALAVWIGLSPTSFNHRCSLASITRTGPGRYTFHVAKQTSGLYVLIHEPGFLRGFQAGPFGADQLAKGIIEVDLPQPATLTARFRPATADKPAPYSACWVAVQRAVMLPGERSMFMNVAEAEAVGTTLEAVFPDLAPPGPAGSYVVEAGTGPLKERYTRGEQAFSDRAEVKFDGATSATVEIVHKPFDPETLKGPYTAVVKVLARDGKPLQGAPYEVTYYDRKFGRKTVAEGTIPSSGVVELRGLAGGVDKPTSMSEFRGKYPPSFNFTVGREDLGSILFVKYDRTNGLVLPAHTNQVAEFTFQMPPVVGEMAPDIELTEVFGGGTLRLADLKGQVVFLDFWATWCGPCQEPMHTLNVLAAKHKDDWAGKVALIGASIDENKATVQRHVRTKGWESVRQMWCAGPDGSGGWQAPQVRTYGVRGVPTALLIDQEGRIVWRGHPGGLNKEGEIGKLLQNK